MNIASKKMLSRKNKMGLMSMFCRLFLLLALANATAIQAQEPTYASSGLATTENSSPGDLASACSDLQRTDFSSIPDAPTHVTRAEIMVPPDGKPSYCNVSGLIEPQIGMEMRLPVKNWNGKFVEGGCGGWCGAIPNWVCPDALSRGYACITTDMGHKGSSMEDISWARNNLQAQMDFGFRATHVAALAGKVITAHYYRRPPKISYYIGCSTGGYQGLVEAQRFPWDFDGIVAGAPDMDETQANFRALWLARAQLDAAGHPIFAKTQLALLHNAALALCDGDDGVKDGIISNPLACQFKPESLRCKPGQIPDCLTDAQVDAARKIYSGPSDSWGRPTSTGGVLVGSELEWGNLWPTQSIMDYFRYALTGYSIKPDFKDTDFDFDRDYQRLGSAPYYEDTNPDLRKLKASGAKLIMIQGATDTLNEPGPAIDYYRMAERLIGSREMTQSFFRLFLVPGMNHCGGGVGATEADWLHALEQWVEDGKAPDVVVAAHPAHDKDPGFTRPLYPYPDYARYKGKGDVNQAQNFMRIPVGPDK